jgi:hypothetical protein
VACGRVGFSSKSFPLPQSDITANEIPYYWNNFARARQNDVPRTSEFTPAPPHYDNIVKMGDFSVAFCGGNL